MTFYPVCCEHVRPVRVWHLCKVPGCTGTMRYSGTSNLTMPMTHVHACDKCHATSALPFVSGEIQYEAEADHVAEVEREKSGTGVAGVLCEEGQGMKSPTNNPILTKCRDCVCYLNPQDYGVVQISTRLTNGDWHVEWVCAGCAGKAERNGQVPWTTKL